MQKINYQKQKKDQQLKIINYYRKSLQSSPINITTKKIKRTKKQEVKKNDSLREEDKKIHDKKIEENKMTENKMHDKSIQFVNMD